jgi:hypothetical protein
VAAGLLAFVFQLFFFDRWTNFMDEGHMLLFADLIAKGGELYRDATVYPLPGSFYFLAGLFRLFEPSILLSRWVVVIQFSAFVALATALMARTAPPRFVAVGVLCLLLYRVWAFPNWHMYSYSTSALLVLLASTLALLEFIDTEETSWLLLSGLLFGLGVLCKQDYGAAVLLASTALLAAHVRTRLAPGRGFWSLLAMFLAPAAAVGAATGIYFYARGILPDLLRFTVLNHFVGMSEYEYRSFPPLFPLFEQDPTLRSPVGVWAFLPAIWMTVYSAGMMSGFLYDKTAVIDGVLKLYYYLPLIAVPLGLFALWQRRTRLDHERTRHTTMAWLALLLLAASCTLLVWLNKPQDYLHLAVLYWPLLCLLPGTLDRCQRKRPVLFRTICAAAFAPALLLVLHTGHLAWLLRTVHSEELPLARAGIRVTPGQARSVGSLIDYIQTRTAPGEAIGVFPYSPMVHFLADRPGPDRTGYILWPFPELANRDRRIIDAMERDQTRLVVMDFIDIQDFPPMREYAPELFEYLVENFVLDRVFTDDEVLPRKLATFQRERATEEGAPVLPSQFSGSTLAIETESLPPDPVPPERWSEFVGEELWPLRRVVALRPSVQESSTILALPLIVPPGTVLRSAVGVHPAYWDVFPQSWVRFDFSLRNDAGRELLFRRQLDPTRNPDDRGWFEFEVDLGRWAGQRIELEFSTQCEIERERGKLMAGWAVPYLVAKSAPTSPAL